MEELEGTELPPPGESSCPNHQNHPTCTKVQRYAATHRHLAETNSHLIALLKGMYASEESAQAALTTERLMHAAKLRELEVADEENRTMIARLEKTVAEYSLRRDNDYREAQRASLETFRESHARAVQLLEMTADVEKLTIQRAFHKNKRIALAEQLRETRRQLQILKVENASLREEQEHQKFLKEAEELSARIGELEHRVQELESQNAELCKTVDEAGVRNAELEREKGELTDLLREEQAKLVEAGEDYAKAQRLLRETHAEATTALLDLQQKVAMALADERVKAKKELHEATKAAERALKEQRECSERRMDEVMNLHAIAVKEREQALVNLEEAQRKANSEHASRLEAQKLLDATCSQLQLLRSELETASAQLEKAESGLEMLREYGDHQECTEVYRSWRLERERLEREIRVLTQLNEKLNLQVALATAVCEGKESASGCHQQELSAVQTLIGSVVRAVQEEALSPRKRQREQYPTYSSE